MRYWSRPTPLCCLPFLAAAGSLACKGSSLEAPTTGLLEVTTSTTGPEPDSDGYTVQVDGGTPQAIAPSGVFSSPDLASGKHTLQLGGVATNCAIAGERIRTFEVRAGETTSVVFEIACAGSTAPATGIPFGTWYLDNTEMNAVQSGAMRVVSPGTILSELSGARARGARLVVKLVGLGDRPVKNADGSFNFAKWQALIDGFKGIDFTSYIADGTIVAHLLIDEPDVAPRWGGQAISQATVEAMAQYSKQLWPGMATIVRALPSWLGEAPITYTNLDAGWVHYTARKGDAAAYLAAQVPIAKRLGLGLALNMNLLDGGDGSSGIPGFSSGKYAMSGEEIRRYGSALLRDGYACAFLMWKYDAAYFARPDVQSAMADLSNQARSHPRTFCRQ
jgi:hypothetical protein